MRRNRIRLTESELHSIVEESVKRIITENSEDAWEKLRRAKASGNLHAFEKSCEIGQFKSFTHFCIIKT